MLVENEFFSKDQKEAVACAIKNAEQLTSGEIRVFFENKSNKEVMVRAVEVFEKLKMHETELRNGVLIYIAHKDKQFAIIGDKGINDVVPENFWDVVKEKMLEYFKHEKFSEGIVKGIQLAGEHLQKHFPRGENDINELPDDITYNV